MTITHTYFVCTLAVLWGHPANARTFPWAHETFECTDPANSNNDFAIKGVYTLTGTPDQCKDKCHPHPGCEGFNYDTQQGICYFKKNIDYQFSKEMEVKGTGVECYVAERGPTVVPYLTTSTIATTKSPAPSPTTTIATTKSPAPSPTTTTVITPAPTSPVTQPSTITQPSMTTISSTASTPSGSSSSSSSSSNGPSGQKTTSNSGGGGSSSGSSSITSVSSNATTLDGFATTSTNETSVDGSNCPKHVWQEFGAVPKCVLSGFNFFTAEVFGTIIVVTLILMGTVIGICCCCDKCKNSKEDSDYGARKKLLGLQLGNFKNNHDYDYDEI